MHDSHAEHVLLIIGVALCVALFAGVVAKWMRIPKVTAFLFAGLLLGPHAGYLIPASAVSWVPETISSNWPIIRADDHHIRLSLFEYGSSIIRMGNFDSQRS